jgi:RNA polymerase sigma factor (sigma-70 family)
METTIQHGLSPATDAELIRKILDGETAVFEILIRRYNPLLYKLARTYGLNHQDAEDMMQEAHLSAYLQLRSFRADAAYKTWLSRILLHKCYHRTGYGSGKYETVAGELITDNSNTMYGSRSDAERSVINRELAAVLEQSLQGLPVIYRAVFVLREMEGFSVAETADLLAITTTNVKVRLNRSKALLQKQLERFYTTADIYEFHLKYCDAIVEKIFQKIGDSRP